MPGTDPFQKKIKYVQTPAPASKDKAKNGLKNSHAKDITIMEEVAPVMRANTKAANEAIELRRTPTNGIHLSIRITGVKIRYRPATERHIPRMRKKSVEYANTFSCLLKYCFDV